MPPSGPSVRAIQVMGEVRAEGLDGQVLRSGSADIPFFEVSIGSYRSEDQAQSALPAIQETQEEAFVKLLQKSAIISED